MDPTSAILTAIARALHISEAATVFWIPMIIILTNRVARLIPDNATGVLKYVRLVMVVLGMHVLNNTGIPAVIDKSGAAIRRADPEAIPEPVIPEELIESPKIQQMFKSGAAAINSKDLTHEG